LLVSYGKDNFRTVNMDHGKTSMAFLGLLNIGLRRMEKTQQDERRASLLRVTADLKDTWRRAGVEDLENGEVHGRRGRCEGESLEAGNVWKSTNGVCVCGREAGSGKRRAEDVWHWQGYARLELVVGRVAVGG
jgi:hypothetical protein